MKYKLIFIISFIPVLLLSQRRSGDNTLHEVSNKAVIQSVFPKATGVVQINEYWYQITDDQGKVFGYAMNSTKHCNEITGYHDATPVMIIINKKGIICKVALLSNRESPGYVNILENNAFFNSWNGKSIQKATAVQPDGYSGATITAKSITKTVQYMTAHGKDHMKW